MNGKYKNYSFWTALAGAIVVFINALGECFGFSIDNDLVSGIIMSIAGILVVLGIVTMSDDKNNINFSESEDDNDDKTSDENEKDK